MTWCNLLSRDFTVICGSLTTCPSLYQHMLSEIVIKACVLLGQLFGQSRAKCYGYTFPTSTLRHSTLSYQDSQVWIGSLSAWSSTDTKHAWLVGHTYLSLSQYINVNNKWFNVYVLSVDFHWLQMERGLWLSNRGLKTLSPTVQA